MTAVAMVLGGTWAQAHDPGEPDAVWFNTLHTPNGVSCCAGTHDCEQLDDTAWRGGKEPGSYDVLWHGKWITFDSSRVLQRIDNPTGSAVACVHNGLYPMCFVRAAEG